MRLPSELGLLSEFAPMGGSRRVFVSANIIAHRFSCPFSNAAQRHLLGWSDHRLG